MPAICFFCPACVGDKALDNDELLLAAVENFGDVPCAALTDHELNQGGKSNLEAPDVEFLAFIEHTSELDGAAAKAVLHIFIKVLEGGPTKHDAAIDNDNVPFLID